MSGIARSSNLVLPTQQNKWVKPDYFLYNIEKILEEDTNPYTYKSIYLINETVKELAFASGQPTDWMFCTLDNPTLRPLNGAIETFSTNKQRWFMTFKNGINTNASVDTVFLANGEMTSPLALLWAIIGDTTIPPTNLRLGINGTPGLTTANKLCESLVFKLPFRANTNVLYLLSNMFGIQNFEMVSDQANQILSGMLSAPNLKWVKGLNRITSIGNSGITNTANLFPENHDLDFSKITAFGGVFLNGGGHLPKVLTLSGKVSTTSFSGSDGNTEHIILTGNVNTLYQSGCFNYFPKLKRLDVMPGFMANYGTTGSFIINGFISEANAIEIANNLADNSGNDPKTFTFGTDNLSVWSDETKALFTNKNYILQ